VGIIKGRVLNRIKGIGMGLPYNCVKHYSAIKQFEFEFEYRLVFDPVPVHLIFLFGKFNNI